MSERFVYVELENVSHFVGRLWSLVRQGRESATFEYDKQWLANPLKFSLEPALYLGPGPQHTAVDQAIFGALGDSAPDRWGRTLMRYAERRRAEKEGRPPRTLNESDYLLLVDDESDREHCDSPRRQADRFLPNPRAYAFRHSSSCHLCPGVRSADKPPVVAESLPAT